MPEHALTQTDVDILRMMARYTGWDKRYTLVADWRIHHGYALMVIETTKMPEGSEPASVDRRIRFEVNGRTERYIANAESPRMVASCDSFGPSTPRALGNLVKAGDMLFVRFYIGNNTTPMTEAGFNHDTCTIEVWRGKEGKERLMAVMPLDDRVYHNDSARGGSMLDWSYRPERERERGVSLVLAPWWVQITSAGIGITIIAWQRFRNR